ncbi:CHAD domain-containing protein [Prosthecomicrobium sp. N25]|uniref:CHAD domain-containing protein n=1 Tax=Prosthecomicrobium sp. N25 TaxID=3129254 RepID=UPI003078A226
MSFRLGRAEPAGAGLKRILLAELALARATLADDVEEAERRIHRVRRTLKRARSLAAVFRPVVGDDHKRRKAVLKEAADLLSEARDADVAVATARALAGRLKDPALAAPLIDRLAAEARAAHERTVDTERAAACLRIAEADAASLPVLEKGDELLVDAFGAAYRRGRKDWKRARDGGAEDEDLLHDWRKRVKDRWHLTLLVEGRTPATTKRIAVDLDRLAELLGDEHDLALLARRLDTDPDAAGGPQPARRLAKAVAARRRRLADKALDLGAALYGRRTEPFMARLDRLRRHEPD